MSSRKKAKAPAKTVKSQALTLRIDFVSTPAVKADTALILLAGDRKLGETAKTLDSLLGGILSHQIRESSPFKANCGQMLTVALPPRGPYTRVILCGLGDLVKLTESATETAGGKILAVLRAHGSKKVVVLNAEDYADRIEGFSLPLALGLGMRLGTYAFETYKTVSRKKDEEDLPESVVFISTSGKQLAREFDDRENLARSIFLARNLVNEPPNRLYPESFAKVIEQTLKPLGVKVEVFGSDRLKKMGMGCMIAVGQASEHPPALVVMSWPGRKNGKGRPEKPVALVGKGITFDSGGLCLKPYEGMVEMKMDMAGAAAVVGAMHVTALRKSPSPVVGVVALAENSLSDEATRPSDIVTSYSGKTVEILNTDAEGRLVLADALTYVQKVYDPKLIIDLATLTGAIMVALGTEYTGAFVNDENLWDTLLDASKASGEKIWRMPLDESFRREMDSPFADIKNVGAGRNGGASLGAAFLGEFIDADRPWAHLDIAGTATQKGAKPTNPKPFASGCGVRLLDEFIRGQE